MQVQPYLMFNGRCEEAAAFYAQAVGAKIEMSMRYADNPEPQPGMTPAGAENKIMHMALRIGEQQVLCSDGECSGTTNFNGFSLALTVDSDAEAQRCYDALAAGGQPTMPLTRTFFASQFGMLTDKFGLGWMVLTEH
jgi:PhnB protein